MFSAKNFWILAIAIMIITIGLDIKNNLDEKSEQQMVVMSIKRDIATAENAQPATNNLDTICRYLNIYKWFSQAEKDIASLNMSARKERIAFDIPKLRQNKEAARRKTVSLFLDQITKNEQIGKCWDSINNTNFDELSFFEEVLHLDLDKEIDPRLARTAFRSLLKIKVEEAKEEVRKEKVSKEEEAPARTRIAALAKIARSWNFSLEEVGIEFHLLTLKNPKPLG